MTSDVLARGKQAAKRRQLPEEVATYVRELILSGEVRPGDFLRMEPIAEAVGVSNTPVREGLLALRGEGFVRLVPRRGFVVAPFTRQDVRDLFWAQAQLAGELAARAAANMTPDGVAKLDAITALQLDAIEAGDRPRIADLGHAFHREINLAAGSHRLSLLLSAMVQHLPNRFYATLEGQVSATRAEHPLLLEAMRERDPQKARLLMTQHIVDIAPHVIEILERRGHWSANGSASLG